MDVRPSVWVTPTPTGTPVLRKTCPSWKRAHCSYLPKACRMREADRMAYELVGVENAGKEPMADRATR
eukprot:7782281-Alexandrium_andersonii.AAC.1